MSEISSVAPYDPIWSAVAKLAIILIFLVAFIVFSHLLDVDAGDVDPAEPYRVVGPEEFLRIVDDIQRDPDSHPELEEAKP